MGIKDAFYKENRKNPNPNRFLFPYKFPKGKTIGGKQT